MFPHLQTNACRFFSLSFLFTTIHHPAHLFAGDQCVCTRAVVSWPHQHVCSQANAPIGKQTHSHICSQANTSMCKQTCPRPCQHVCKLAGAFLATSACPQGSKYIPSHANVSLVTSARLTCPPLRYFFFCLFCFANHLSPATPVSACKQTCPWPQHEYFFLFPSFH